jgi:hypothetical protein
MNWYVFFGCNFKLLCLSTVYNVCTYLRFYVPLYILGQLIMYKMKHPKFTEYYSLRFFRFTFMLDFFLLVHLKIIMSGRLNIILMKYMCFIYFILL